MTRYAVALVIGGAFIASAVRAEPARDVAYYLAHPAERAATYARCKNDPGRLGNTPNCRNAASATFKASLRSKKMPSIK